MIVPVAGLYLLGRSLRALIHSSIHQSSALKSEDWVLCSRLSITDIPLAQLCAFLDHEYGSPRASMYFPICSVHWRILAVPYFFVPTTSVRLHLYLQMALHYRVTEILRLMRDALKMDKRARQAFRALLQLIDIHIHSNHDEEARRAADTLMPGKTPAVHSQ